MSPSNPLANSDQRPDYSIRRHASMNHNDHVNLLRDGVVPGTLWADLGSGGGAFTLALAELLGDGGTIISVDKDKGALRDQGRSIQSRFPSTHVEYRAADFSTPLDLPPLDGI